METQKFTFNFKRLIEILCDPIIVALDFLYKKFLNSYSNKTLEFTGGVTGKGTIIGDGIGQSVVISTKIDPTKHIHSENTLPASVEPIGNSLVKRDDSGAIYGSGTNTNGTGFLISDNTDLVELFKTKSESRISVETLETGIGKVCTDISLSRDLKNTNKLILNIEWSDYCKTSALCVCCSD